MKWLWIILLDISKIGLLHPIPTLCWSAQLHFTEERCWGYKPNFGHCNPQARGTGTHKAETPETLAAWPLQQVSWAFYDLALNGYGSLGQPWGNSQFRMEGLAIGCPPICQEVSGRNIRQGHEKLNHIGQFVYFFT